MIKEVNDKSLHEDAGEVNDQIPHSDSGYASLPDHAEKERLFQELIEALDALEFDREHELDSEVKDDLSKCKQTSEKQTKLVRQYLRHLPKDEERIRKECHFKRLDRALRDTFIEKMIPFEEGADNEGSALFELARNCLNQDAIALFLKAISIEKNRTIPELLESYKDKNQYNILHCLADLIVKKHEAGLPITKNNRDTFFYCANFVSSLSKERDKLCERTPEEIITQSTPLDFSKAEEKEQVDFNTHEEEYAETYHLKKRSRCTFL